MSEIAEAHSTENSFTKFIFENSLYSEETFSVIGVISFVSLNLYVLDPLQFVVHGSRVFIQSNK